MAPDRIKSLLERNPFLPFQLRLADGRILCIALPKQVQPGPGWQWLWLPSDNDNVKRLDLNSVDAIIEEESSEPYFAVRSEKGAAMTIEKFDEFMKRRPFAPFTVHTADGEKFDVKSPEFASRTQQGRTIFVSTGGERTECIDLLLVTRLSAGIENTEAK